MGVPQIWELLRPYIKNKRIPFKKFVSDFKRLHQRSPIIAIDGYTWIFECGFLINSDSVQKYDGYGKISKALVNFVYRLKELLALDISFILVFDGNLKPWFKNNFSNHKEEQLQGFSNRWAEHLRYHHVHGSCFGHDANSGEDFMNIIKSILNIMKISYIQACGEGEAQCAWLQKNGYVDYVLSNDSDSLMFGCTKMLRNYSKAKDDVGATHASSSRSEAHSQVKDAFVTLVDLDDIQARSKERYTWWSLLFFGVLLGADYNQGVAGLGKQKAARLAQCKDPDFAKSFRDLFHSPGEFVSTRRTQQYIEYQNNVLNYCEKESAKLFGRKYKKWSKEGWPCEEAIMYYFHPFLIPEFDSSVLDARYNNISGSPSYDKIDFTELGLLLRNYHLQGVSNFDKWFVEIMQESFALRYLLLNEVDGKVQREMKITDEKCIYEEVSELKVACWRVRYNLFILPLQTFYEAARSPNKSPSPTKRSPSKRQINNMKYVYSIWIPKDLIPNCHPLIENFERERKAELEVANARALSRKKRIYSPQSSTLDKFLSKHSSPVKDIGTLSSIKIPVLEQVKKRLFVKEDSVDELFDEALSDEDSSLIVLGESEVDKYGLALSPPRLDTHVFPNLLLSDSDSFEMKESPLKKHKVDEALE